MERPERATSQLTFPSRQLLSERNMEKALTNDRTLLNDVNVGERCEEHDRDDGPKGSGRLIDISKDLWSITSLGKGSQGTRAGVDA